MLCKRLIASILCRDGVVVQSRQFKHTNVVGNAQTATDFFNMWAIDELIVLDVSRDKIQREKFIKAIDQLSTQVFVPLTVGGRITSVEEARQLFRLGADKIVVNTEAYKTPKFISDLATSFGCQAIVVSIDVRDNVVHIDRGKVATCSHPEVWAKTAQDFGAGEILLRSIDRDGMGGGYDLELISKVARNVTIPIIASGGVGNWEHLVGGIEAGADAVAVGNIFHYTEQSTVKAKRHLQERGILVRPISFFNNDTPRNVRYEEYAR